MSIGVICPTFHYTQPTGEILKAIKQRGNLLRYAVCIPFRTAALTMNSTSPLSYYNFTMETVAICEAYTKNVENNVFLVMGITFNSILLILIKRFSSAYIGNYKYLLAAFALFDILLCTLHGLLNPVSRRALFRRKAALRSHFW